MGALRCHVVANEYVASATDISLERMKMALVVCAEFRRPDPGEVGEAKTHLFRFGIGLSESCGDRLWIVPPPLFLSSLLGEWAVQGALDTYHVKDRRVYCAYPPLCRQAPMVGNERTSAPWAGFGRSSRGCVSYGCRGSSRTQHPL